MRHLHFVLLASAALLSLQTGSAQTATTYQKPPAPIEQLLNAPPTPRVQVSPSVAMLLIEQPATFPSIAEVAEPRYRLAGLRLNPITSSPSVQPYAVDLHLQLLDGSAPRAIAGLPAKLRASNLTWSPDSRYLSFSQRGTTTLELWILDANAASAHRVASVQLNAVLGSAPCEWMPSSNGLLCKLIPANRGAAPQLSTVPAGPHISENLGKVTPAPTYEDLLATPDDERLFEFYATSQLAVVSLTGKVQPLPIRGILDRVSPSPDGQFALVTALHRPFSYTVPYSRFPLLSEVVTLKTGAAKPLFDRPVIDNLPISRDAVEAGPRDYVWRSDTASTLAWAEAADGGDPKVNAAIRDRVFQLEAPFQAQPQVILELPMRLQHGYGENGAALVWSSNHLALATESRWADRRTRTVAFDPSAPGKIVTIYEGSSQDRYGNPGRPVTRLNAAGKPLLQLTGDGSAMIFFSPGATPKGDQPFVGAVPVSGGAERILVRSGADEYAEPLAVLAGEKALFRRESATVQPNLWLYSLNHAGDPTQVTHFSSPFEGIQLPTRQLLHYKRADGLDLTATLWLPAGYNKSQGPLPALMEAYPAEFKTRAAAAQVSGSSNRFPSFGWGGSPVYFAQVGYAVLENATIPIIGEGSAEPNDSYTGQLVAGAKAAVDYAVSLGVVDPKRIAVMGHSYGAFMTANLLAHSDLFRAGIARSGAYNRTLTPYGFQNEERTYWQAPQVYYDMSPFSFADRIKAPILLIHGEADDNTGTYPIQSERFYAALKGQGATVRLVTLPLEPHHYGARESVEHMLWEMDRWLDTYVKPPVPDTSTTTNDTSR